MENDNGYDLDIITVSEAMIGQHITSEYVIALVNSETGRVITYKYPFFDREDAKDNIAKLVKERDIENWISGFPAYCYTFEQEKEYKLTFH